MEVKCDICGRQFNGKNAASKKASLARHIRHVHDGIRDQRCSQCEFDTTDYRILAKHMEKQHGIIKDTTVKERANNAKVKGIAKDRAMKVSANNTKVQGVAKGNSASAGVKSKGIDSNADCGIAYRVLTPSMYRSVKLIM